MEDWLSIFEKATAEQRAAEVGGGERDGDGGNDDDDDQQFWNMVRNDSSTVVASSWAENQRQMIVEKEEKQRWQRVTDGMESIGSKFPEESDDDFHYPVPFNERCLELVATKIQELSRDPHRFRFRRFARAMGLQDNEVLNDQNDDEATGLRPDPVNGERRAAIAESTIKAHAERKAWQSFLNYLEIRHGHLPDGLQMRLTVDPEKQWFDEMSVQFDPPDLTVMNMFRRFLLAMVPSLGFTHISVIENRTTIPPEIFKHLFGRVPIMTTRRPDSFSADRQYIFEVNVACSPSEVKPRPVTGADMKCINDETLVTRPDHHILFLKPGQSIHLRLRACLNSSRQHFYYCPVYGVEYEISRPDAPRPRTREEMVADILGETMTALTLENRPAVYDTNFYVDDGSSENPPVLDTIHFFTNGAVSAPYALETVCLEMARVITVCMESGR